MLKFAIAIGALVASLSLAAATTAEGATPEQLADAGWTCFLDPGAPRIVCSNPGHGRPTAPPDPNRRPSYSFQVFRLDGGFIGTIHLIRSDLYRGQPCPQAGGQYFFIAPIGYFRCEHF